MDEAREKFERTEKSEDRLNYLLLNKNLMAKQGSLLNAQQDYDRIVMERIEDIEGPDKQ
ncbi:MAG: hypothetical protein KAR20_20885 [Candidatus Heimdallarchaeota archaeon]|nr:hypothetical protein [Candidatus Heimdallarchaeota archaeon]